MRVFHHNDVICAGSEVKLFGSRLKIFAYLDSGILVDTGPSRFAGDFASFFDTYPVQAAVLTHFHEDHSGNAHLLEKRGIPVYIDPSSIHLCRRDARLSLYRRLFWGKRKKFGPLPLPGTIEGENKTFEVLKLPGHSFDHIALYNPAEGYVYTGDLFVSPKTRLLMPTESVPVIINSLQYLLQKDFNTIYCAHAGVVERGREMLQQKLEYLENLQGNVLELYKKGLGVKAIDHKLFPPNPPLTLVSGKEWASEHIVRSIIRDSRHNSA